MSTAKVAALLRQADLIEKAKFLTDGQKAVAVDAIKKEINSLLGQGELPLADPVKVESPPAVSPSRPARNG